MKLSHLKFLPLGLMALAVPAFLFTQTRALPLEQHDRWTSDLRQLRQLDSSLTQEVLESRFSLLTNYDPLVATSQQMEALQAGLPVQMQTLYPHGQAAAIQPSLQAYQDALTQKELLVEDFKSKNAILRNSLAYFPVLSESLMAHAGGSADARSLAAMIDLLLRKTLAYNSGSHDLAPQIPPLIEALARRRSEAPADQRTDFDLLIGHARLIFSQRQELDTLLAQMVTLPSLQRNDDLFAADQGQYAQAEQHTRAYGLALDIFCGLLLVAVALILAQLNKSARAVRQANDTLESRVEERTLALAEAKSRLDVLVEHLGQLMQEVSAGADTIATASGVLSASSVGAERIAGRIADTMREVTQSADVAGRAGQEMVLRSRRQDESAGQADSEMRQVVRAVEQVAGSARQMAQAAHRAAATAESGGQVVSETISSMERIHQQVKRSSVKVVELGHTGRQIGAIVQTINKIAEQTNLLALNASIEAARAGEQGRGFAVVAGEVRKLAERTANATREIGGLVGAIQSQVQEAVEAIESSSAEAAAGAAQNQQTGRSLEEILTTTHAVTAEVEVTAAATETMTKLAQTALATVATVRDATQANEAGVDTLHRSASEAAANIRSVFGMLQEQAANIAEINQAAARLGGMAQSLNSLAQQCPSENETDTIAPLEIRLRKAA